jgi:hypothetical protein
MYAWEDKENAAGAGNTLRKRSVSKEGRSLKKSSSMKLRKTSPAEY